MEKIIIKKIWINNTQPIILINDYKVAKEDNSIIISKFSNEEWKAYIFGEYNNNKFDYRKQLIVEGIISNNKIGSPIQIRISKNTPIGEGILKEKHNGKYTITNLQLYKNNKPLKDIKEFFVPIDNSIIKDKEIFINGLYKINYDFINYYLNYHFFKLGKEYTKKGSNKIYYNVPEAKFSAFCSYLAIKDTFISKGYNISQLDCFIIGERLEYDALLLKKDISPNKRIYSKNEILATIEIKTSGYFNNSIKKVKKDFTDYMNSQKIDNIPHIYISVHETSIYYNRIHSKFNSTSFIPMFCKIKETNDYITIPYEYDIEKLLIKKH